MQVNMVDNTSSALTNAVGNSVMDKDDFLKMLVTQLQYQDPMSPMENTDFSAQLAQFSQLEQLENMNEKLSNTADANLMMTQSINNSMATTLIGKEVRSNGGDFAYKEGESGKSLYFDLGDNAALTRVKIYNEQGDLVRTIEKSNMPEGENSFVWDGLTDSGSMAGYGNYRFEVYAESESGELVKAQPYQRLRIDGVKYIDGMAYLMAGDNTISLGDVLEILHPEGDNT